MSDKPDPTRGPDTPARDAQVPAPAFDPYGRFIANLAHDLRGSLNGVVLMLEVLRRELAHVPAAAGAVDDIVLMQQSIADAIANVERHVLADRLRRNILVNKDSTIDLNAILLDSARQLEAAALPAPARISVTGPHGASMIADPELTACAVRELLANALKHSSGPVTACVLPRQGGWMLQIQSDGVIPPERLAQLIDPVWPGDPHRRGIGLVIVALAAPRLGATFTATSHAGKVTFSLTWPPAH